MQKIFQFKTIAKPIAKSKSKFSLIAKFIGALSGSIAMFAAAGSAIAGDSPYFDQWGKFIYHYADQTDRFDQPLAAEIDAAMALLAIQSPLDAEVSMREYAIAVERARLLMEKARILAPNSPLLLPMSSAIAHHQLALQFWDDCSELLTNEFFCNENMASVKAVLQKYPKPRNVEGILPDVTEVLRRYPRPWLKTRVRITRREVVEYVPTSEQKRALVLLWQQAQADTMLVEKLICPPTQFPVPIAPRVAPSPRLY
ncbi:hypothetical protein Pse7367_1668 [Thalassoporum mexicanum PCC 7367]|uniref:hypothetical protein n=1 Tax=Thalassoporum mexicanum TaxID=3457544 RepID=UPI00029F9B14|nr:hypothetical protein [Pseudanabaena sp. PCC 7367]AFY69956.1 hypothetical protein Pse7367_1668 [Pseudanabaena sp. PCC 7367]